MRGSASTCWFLRGALTDDDHYLNRMFNNILIWKRRGEEAVAASGVPYTIVRPGGLSDDPGGQPDRHLRAGAIPARRASWITRADVGAGVRVGACARCGAQQGVRDSCRGRGSAGGLRRGIRIAERHPDAGQRARSLRGWRACLRCLCPSGRRINPSMELCSAHPWLTNSRKGHCNGDQRKEQVDSHC